MNTRQVINEFSWGIISMRRACRELDNLGYTMQERRSIIMGIIHYRQYKEMHP